MGVEMSTLKLIGRLAVIALAAVMALDVPAVQPDFDGDGKADLLWQRFGSEDRAIWLMNGTVPTSMAPLLPPFPTEPIGVGWHVTDLNGDGMDDLIVHAGYSWTSSARLMQGTTQVASVVLRIGAAYPTHVGDFNGDGKGDLLWYDPPTGTTALWLMDGFNATATAWLLVHPHWRVADVADFNGDGMSDLLWRNGSTGETAIWLMNGTTFVSGAIVLSYPSWAARPAGDLDGDGKADLMWRNDTTGETALWLMNGASMAAGAIVVADLDWSVSHIADLNGDGRSDLVWQKLGSVGGFVDVVATHAWLMNGLAMTAGGPLPVSDRLSSVVGDFDGDGRDDLIDFWYDADTEFWLYKLWLMDALSIKASAPLMWTNDWYLP